MTNRRVDHHRFTIVGDPGTADTLVTIRNSLVTWATSDRNQVELVGNVPSVGELTFGDGWFFVIELRYRTSSDDGDGYDLARGVRTIVDRADPNIMVRTAVEQVPVEVTT